MDTRHMRSRCRLFRIKSQSRHSERIVPNKALRDRIGLETRDRASPLRLLDGGRFRRKFETLSPQNTRSVRYAPFTQSVPRDASSHETARLHRSKPQYLRNCRTWPSRRRLPASADLPCVAATEAEPGECTRRSLLSSAKKGIAFRRRFSRGSL